MAAAYSLSAPDCDVHYFADAPAGLFCVNCDSYIGLGEFVPQLDLRLCKFDFCFTYDGRLLVSERAKRYLGEHCATPLKFTIVDKSAGYYALSVESAVLFDKDRRRTRFERRCSRCGSFESIVGATPAFILEPNRVSDMGVYRTDLCFGTGREKSPVILVGGKLKQGLAHAFPELDFQEANRPSKQHHESDNRHY